MPQNISSLKEIIKKYRIYIFTGVIFCYIFYDAFMEDKLKTHLGAKIYILFQDISPKDARKLVIDEAKKNPEFKEFQDIMTYDDPVVWSRMFVCKNEYFFPRRWPKSALIEEGYYVNPKTKEVRYVKNDFSFRFFWFSDIVSIRVNN